MSRNQISDPHSGPNRLVFDPVRRRSVRLSPEEDVRQAMITYLTRELGVPPGLIAVEKAIAGSAEPLRADIVVYDRNADPWMIVECKAPEIRITQGAFDQISRYNKFLEAPYLLISNGSEHFCCHQDSDSGSLSYLGTIPRYPVLGKESEEEG